MKKYLSSFAYPLPKASDYDWAPTFSRRLLMSGKSWMPYRGLRSRDGEVHLQSRSDIVPLSDGDFALIVLTHNDLRFLPSFLGHYRAMGVSRFVCVDDRSTDGTSGYLLAQPDVDLYESNVRYKEADRGKIWREQLIARYGTDRWYLVVDSDEYFIYETMGVEPIAAYARRLESRGIRRVPAPMLDLYPIGRLDGAAFTGKTDEMPWDVATHFDGDGYSGGALANALSLQGGVRARVFEASGELMKYPLVRWDRFCSLGRTVHRPRPALYNFPPLMAALLHFKIFSDFRERMSHAIQEAQHHRGAELYQTMLERLDSSRNVELGYSASIPYTGVADLVRRGFMRPLN